MTPTENNVGGYGRQLPPDPAHVYIYFEQLGKGRQLADVFYQDFQQRGWRYETGNAVKNWKALATSWIKKRSI